MHHKLPKAASPNSRRPFSAAPANLPPAGAAVQPIDAERLRRIFTPREPVTDDRPTCYELLERAGFRLTLGERLVLFFRLNGNGLTRLACVALSVLCVVYAVAEAARVL